MANIEVESPNVTYSDNYIEADYDYCTTHVEPVNGKLKVSPFFFRNKQISKMPGGLPNSPPTPQFAGPSGSAT